MPGKLLQNQLILWPALAEYNTHRWFLPASLKAGTNDRKMTETKTDCNYRHSLVPCAMRISLTVGGLRLILCFFRLILYYSDIFNFYLLPAVRRDLFIGGFSYLQIYQGINTKAHGFCVPIQHFSHWHPQFVLFIYIFHTLTCSPLCCHPPSAMLSKLWWIITQISVSLKLPLWLVFGSFQSALLKSQC